MQKATLCNWIALWRHRYITTSTEGRSGHAAKDLRVVTNALLVMTSREAVCHRSDAKFILLAMKLTTILLTAAFLNVSAKGLSQNITFSGNNVSLERVFQELKKQTGYVFFYNATVLEGTKPISIEAENVPFDEFMRDIFQGQPVKYLIEDKTVIITRKPPSTVLSPRDISFPPSDVLINVTNAQGEFLSGVNIIIQRTGRGTTTNAKGNALLKNANNDDVLIVSMVGYKTQEIRVANKSDFAIVMQVDVDGLDKVVIQGYSNTSERLRTGNIATVTAKEIERQPVMNPLEALQGRVAGLEIQQTTGHVSSPFKVEIRGRNSINDVPGDPLYIIDGVPLTILELGGNSHNSTGSTGFMQGKIIGPAAGQSPFFSINPSDIESITVLKDADATAIYGSRGANGVMIITTKKGKAGKVAFEINVNQGYSKVTRNYKLLDNQQYREMRLEAFKNDGISYDDGNAYDLTLWDSTHYTNWQNYLWGGIGQTTDAQASISGGDKFNSFRIASGFRRQTDITTAAGSSTRGSLQFNLNHNSSDQRLNLAFTNLFSVTSTDIIGIQGAVSLPPNAPGAFDANGNLNFRGWDPVAYTMPFSNLLQPYNASTYFLNSGLDLKYEITNGLIFKNNIGFSFATAPQNQKYPIASQDPFTNPKGSAQFSYNNTRNWIIEPQLLFKKFLLKGLLNVLVGASLQTVKADGNSISGDGYVNDNLLGSISNAPVKDAEDYFGRYKYAAVFSQINYNWKSKYILNLSARRDGSSRFGPGKQFGNFGAVGFAWNFSEEEWLKNNLISSGKVRGSYGVTGSDQIGNYQYLTRWSATGIAPYENYQSYIPRQHANPDYHWEENKKLELALDLSFLKNTIDIELSWYRNRCDNQLINFPLPIQTGFAVVTSNSPANVQNTGFESVARFKILGKKDFSWQLKFNIGVNKNKLLAYPNLAQSPHANRYVIGEPLNISNRLEYTGVDSETGLYTFLDKNKDGQILTNGPEKDLIPYNLNPKYFGGFGSDFSVHGFSLNLYFTYRKKIDFNPYVAGSAPGDISNKPIEVLDRWTKPGDVARFAKYTTMPDVSYSNFQRSDGVLSNAYYIRLNNLYVSYQLSDRICKKINLSALQFYIQGQNVFLITNYDGIDPQVPVFEQMPLSKILTAGLKIKI